MPACHISMPHQDAGMLICWHRSASGCLHAAPECRTAGGMPCRLRIEERGATQCAQPNSHTLVSGSQIAPGFPFHNLSQQVSLQCIDSPKPLCRYVAPLELVQRQSPIFIKALQKRKRANIVVRRALSGLLTRSLCGFQHMESACSQPPM